MHLPEKCCTIEMVYHRNRKGDDIEIQEETHGRFAVPRHAGIGFRMRNLQYRGKTGTEGKS